nr:shikimate dehydrogenase [Candidatus Sigynarchaeota archaeon]
MEGSISGKTHLLCVIGDPIEHTMSPAMHNAALQELGLDYVYVAFHVKSNDLKKAVEGFKALHVAGINVTIPHKVSIMQHIDDIDEVARKIGAINTIKNVDGKLHAMNTDAGGALEALNIGGIDYKGKHVLFLGAGGAAKAVSFALARDVNSITLASIEQDMNMARSLGNDLRAYAPSTRITEVLMSEKILEREVKGAGLLVNATPVGMHPNEGKSLVKDDWIQEGQAVFDLVYNPLETKLVHQAKSKGCKIAHGLDMLVHQGAIAFEWWTGKKPNVDLMKRAAMDKLGIKV